MRREEITFGEAVIAILLAPFFMVFWIVKELIEWIFLIGLVIVAAVLGAVTFVFQWIKGER